MPRLSRDVVAAREKLAREMFGAGKSADAVQKALQDGWNGMKMAPGRLAEIEQEAAGSIGSAAHLINVPPATEAEQVSVKPTVTLVNPLSSETPITLDSSGAAVPTPAPKKYNPAADGFLDFCRSRAKAAGMMIVDVSEEIYEEWLASKA